MYSDTGGEWSRVRAKTWSNIETMAFILYKLRINYPLVKMLFG